MSEKVQNLICLFTNSEAVKKKTILCEKTEQLSVQFFHIKLIESRIRMRNKVQI